MKLLVLAGGFGTRLQSVVSDVPKALAPVDNIPFLAFQIENWIAQGIRSFVFLLHHQAELVQKYLESERHGLMLGCEFESLVEPTPLGTGGSIANAVRKLRLQGKFLVTNADTWLGSGVAALSSANAPAMGVIEVQNSGRYGSVLFDRNGKLSHFLEKDPDAKSGWINAGLCIFSADSFLRFSEVAFSLESHCFPLWVKEGRLNAVPIQCSFIDIGVPEDYHRFCRWQESGRMGVL